MESNNKNNIYVKIVKGSGWYEDYVGKIFKVYPETEKYYGGQGYRLVDMHAGILVSECEVVHVEKIPDSCNFKGCGRDIKYMCMDRDGNKCFRCGIHSRQNQFIKRVKIEDYIKSVESSGICVLNKSNAGKYVEDLSCLCP